MEPDSCCSWSCRSWSRPAIAWRKRQIQRAEAPSVGDETLCCFMASHTTSLEGVAKLRVTLCSIAKQLPAPPAVFLSWSSTQVPEVLAAARRLLMSKEWPFLFVLTQQAARLSQFEHMRALAIHVASQSDRQFRWIFFSDDDDLWSEQRYALFAGACASHPESLAIVCTRKARPSGRPDSVESSQAAAARDASDVRSLLATRTVRLTDLNALDIESESFNLDEYFDYAVQFEQFERFFRAAPPVVIRHKLCDLAFSAHMKECCSPTRFTPTEPGEFVYYYTRCDGETYAATDKSMSSGLAISEADQELAQGGLAEVVTALRRGGGEAAAATIDEAHLALLVAALRQEIEQELIQLRVLSAKPKLARIDDLCSRAVTRMLKDHPLQQNGPAALEPFRQWCVHTCKGAIVTRLLRLLAFDLPRR